MTANPGSFLSQGEQLKQSKASGTLGAAATLAIAFVTSTVHERAHGKPIIGLPSGTWKKADGQKTPQWEITPYAPGVSWEIFTNRWWKEKPMKLGRPASFALVRAMLRGDCALISGSLHYAAGRPNPTLKTMFLLLATSRGSLRFVLSLSFLIAIFGKVHAASSVAIKDDGDPGFTVTDSSWGESSDVGYNLDFLSGIGSSSANWSFVVNSGSYRISLTWPTALPPYNKFYSPAAPVSVFVGGKEILSTSINQQLEPGDRTDAGVKWKDIGIVEVTSNPLKIELSTSASLYTMADAVRIERIDGTPILTPTIKSISPPNAPLSGGIPITVTGTLFSSGTKVYFGSTPASSVKIQSSTQIIAVCPALPEGAVDVKIVTPDGLSTVEPDGLEYAVGRTLDNSDPGFTASAPAALITLQGYLNDYVYPGGTTGASASWTLPVNADFPQEVAATWYNPGAPYNGSLTDSATFEIWDGQTQLASVNVNQQTTPKDLQEGGVGWKVLGAYLFPSGTAKIVLRNNSSKSLIADAVRVEELQNVPKISNVSPDTGLPGAEVTITGSGFVAGSTVKFGSLLAGSVSIKDEFTLTCTAPLELLAGIVPITITTPNGDSVTRPDAFTSILVDILPVVWISAPDKNASEPGTVGGTATFKISRTGSTASSLTVRFTVSGSATAGIDYASLGNSVTIPAGAVSVTKRVTALADTALEGPETISVTLNSSLSYVLGSSTTATVTIVDSSWVDFVQSAQVTTNRNNFDGWVGFRFKVGASPLTVKSLGRFFQEGNVQDHEIRIIDPSTQLVVASAVWTPTGGVDGQFKYANLDAPITLDAYKVYYIASKENDGGDYWTNWRTVLSTASDAQVLSAVYLKAGTWRSVGTGNNSYVPLSFQYR